MTLGPGIADALVEHARRDFPRECCGVLLGEPGGGGRVVRALPCRNAAEDPRVSFEADPCDLLSAQRLARDSGLEVAGYYHSHPSGPPVPSARDAALGWDGILHVIVGLDPGPARPGLRAWEFSGGEFREEPLTIAGSDDPVATGAPSR